MAVTNPFNNYPKVLAAMPLRWATVSPHADNYLEGADVNTHTVAVALYSSDGGTVAYYDPWGGPKTITLIAGIPLPGAFTRVLASGTTAGAIWAGFMEGPVS